MTLLQGVVNTFVIFLSRIIGHTVDRVVFKVERGHGPAFWIVSIVCEIILGFLAHIIVMWFSRHREFRADAGAAKLVGRQPMINALLKLQQPHRQADLPDEVAALGINGKVKSLFSSHPPIEARVAALKTLR
jgi:heat shock protein HtpX